jgi:hypothetical protein
MVSAILVLLRNTGQLRARTPFVGAIYGLHGAAWPPDEGGTWAPLAWLVGTDGRIVKITF